MYMDYVFMVKKIFEIRGCERFNSKSCAFIYVFYLFKL